MVKYYIRCFSCFFVCVYVRFHPKFNYRGRLHTLLKRKYKIEKHFRKDLDFIVDHEGTFQLYRSAGHRFESTKHLPAYHAVFRAKEKGYQPVIVNLMADSEIALQRCSMERPSVRDPSEWSLSTETPKRQSELMAGWNIKKDRIMEQVRKNGIPVIDISTMVEVEISFNRLLKHIDTDNTPTVTRKAASDDTPEMQTG